MRYDTPVFFQKRVSGNYNAKTGNYDADIVIETEVYADVTDASEKTLRIVYGSIKEGARVIRIQDKYDAEFSTIRIEDTVFKVDKKRRLRNKEVFIVSGVSEWQL